MLARSVRAAGRARGSTDCDRGSKTWAEAERASRREERIKSLLAARRSGMAMASLLGNHDTSGARLCWR